MIITKTPYRVSMFGGGTDHPIWFNKHGGSVVSFTIDKFCYINLRELPSFFVHKFRVSYSKVETVENVSEILHPAVREAFIKYGSGMNLELHHHGDLPAQSGVGSSSAFVVGIIKALYSLKNLEIEGPALANQAITFEQNDLKEIVGSQDQIACAMGGINFIEFTGDNFWVAKKIELSKEYLTDLESRMVLVYSGIGRISSNISKTLLENLDLKSNLMHRTRKLAIEFNDLLVNKENLDSVAELLKESWSLKKELNTNSIPIELENIYQFALSKGAQAGKILGAGGGGFFLFWLKPGSKEKFIKDMTPLVTVPFSITNQGCSRIS